MTEGDAGVSAAASRNRSPQETRLAAVADVEHRRRELVEAVASGKTGARRAAALISRDAARLDAAARPRPARALRRAWVAAVRVQPKGWRFALWVPVPLALARFAIRRFAAGHASREQIDALVHLLRVMPGCGKVVGIREQATSVDIWLL